MVEVKNKDVRTLMALNREILGSNEIKASVEKPLGLSITAQRNFKVLAAEFKRVFMEEDTMKQAYANKDKEGKSIKVDNGRGGEKYDIPEDKLELLEKELEAYREETISIPISKFSEPVCEKIVIYVKDEAGVPAHMKCDALLDYLADIKQPK